MEAHRYSSITLTMLMLVVVCSSVKAQFSDANRISGFGDPHDGMVVDMDGDGDLDVLAGHSEDVGWFENNGQGEFIAAHPIEEGGVLVSSIHADDLNGDGEMDVLVTQGGSGLLWFQNDGNGGWIKHEMNSPHWPDGLSSGDLDGDGLTDILIAGSHYNDIGWYRNLGFNQFTSFIDIASFGYDTYISVSAVDLDGDGDLDFLSTASQQDAVSWFENLGDGNFSSQSYLTNSADGSWSAEAADIDNDGDLDIVSVNRLADTVTWFENLGEGSFSEVIVLAAEIDDPKDLSLDDLDNDGDVDVTVGAHTGAQVIWFQNEGGGVFSESQVLSEDMEDVRAIDTGDMNSDGIIDIVGFSNQERKIAWYENQGGGAFETEKIVALARQFSYVDANDIDGDGDMDILTSVSGFDLIGWYENLGGGVFTSEDFHEVTNEADGAHHTLLVDLDSDGDYDVLSSNTNTNQLSWYENDGSGIYPTTHILQTTGNQLDVCLADDLDNDGDLDIVFSCTSGDVRIGWFQNLGNGSFSDQNIIDNQNSQVWSLNTGDLDGDGDADVIGISNWADMVYWFENDGEGNFSEMNIITEEANSVKFVTSADMDSDGDIDVIAGISNRFIILENLGNSEFAAPFELPNINYGSVYFGLPEDWNGDGNMDLTALSQGTVLVYSNLGDYQFEIDTLELQTDNMAWFSTAAAADLDGDNDSDLLITGSSDEMIAWYENEHIVLGCMDPEACNYNSLAQLDDSSCCYGICGCIDTDANNYNPEADCEDGSCIYHANGVVFYDANEDGEWQLFEGEFPLAGQQLIVQPLGWIVWTNDEGEYMVNDLPQGNYTLEVIPDEEFPYNTTLNPVEIQIGSSPVSTYFGLSNESPNYGINVSCHPSGTTLLCDDFANYFLCFENEGNTLLDVVVEFQYDPNFVGYSTITPIDSAVGNSLYFSFEDLLPGQSECLNVWMHNPSVEFTGQFLDCSVNVIGYDNNLEVASGEGSTSNSIICAYDPNDKHVFPEGYTEDHLILNETKLEYRIRFQNTGNAPATDVLITDTLDVNLDLSSFELKSNSHLVQVTMKPEERVIEFLFPDIMLPDSVANEPESHGFVSFWIEPHEGLAPGTELNNTANIYFDSNPPIITNTTWNTIHECDESWLFETSVEEDCPSDMVVLTIDHDPTIDWEYSYSWLNDGDEIGSDLTLMLGPILPESATLSFQVSNPLCVEQETYEIDLNQELSIYSCMGDLNCDQHINVLDVLLFLSENGCDHIACHYDLDLNGSVGVSDMLQLLSVYGENCAD